MARKWRRILKIMTSAMVVGSSIGVFIGAYLHLSTWFFIAMGLLFMSGVGFYPEGCKIQERRDDRLYDEE